MPEGLVLGWALVGVVLGWLVVDLIFWLTGRQTFSQYLAMRARASKRFAVLGTIFLLALAVFLIFHFEFPQALLQ